MSDFIDLGRGSVQFISQNLLPLPAPNHKIVHFKALAEFRRNFNLSLIIGDFGHKWNTCM